jgi:DNA-binding transcriptional LysR family regulator
MSGPLISLEQWRALIGVVDAGGYAQAAETLNKSQSAVSYAIQKLENLLEVKVFEIQGRKAVLTEAGRALYRRAQALVDEAQALERSAADLATGVEAEIGLAVDSIYPTWLILKCLGLFADERPQTRTELRETVLTGAQEALLTGTADLAIVNSIPTGFLGDALMAVRFAAVAHPDHVLHKLGRELTLDDLRRERQLVTRDSSTRERADAGWLGAERRWTVTTPSTSIGAACRGYGFAWFPVNKIKSELEAGILKPLPLREGAERFAQLYLVLAQPEHAGPGVRRLAEIIRTETAQLCESRHDT